MRSVTEETRAFRQEMREDMRALRSDFGASQRQLAHIGWGLVATLVAAVVVLIVALA